jgi:hypothetical protein
MFTPNRHESRQFFFQVWQKFQNKQPLEPMEKMICDVILAHPEYHTVLTPNHLDKDYLPEMGATNPFLHMGLHIALHEQLSVDRPQGIRAIFQSLRMKYPDNHQLEHQCIECLAQMIWEAQRHQQMPDENTYINCLQKL